MDTKNLYVVPEVFPAPREQHGKGHQANALPPGDVQRLGDHRAHVGSPESSRTGVVAPRGQVLGVVASAGSSLADWTLRAHIGFMPSIRL